MAKTKGTHDGSKNLGAGSEKVSYTHVQRAPSGKGGKRGTSAEVSSYNATSIKVGKVKREDGGYSKVADSKGAKGEDAGGKSNLGTSVKKVGNASNNLTVPEHGSANARPAGVHACDGTYAPKAAATKPAAKTKD